MSKFEMSWASMVEALVGTSVAFDGESVMETFAPVGLPGSGVPTCGSVHAVKRALKHTSGLHATSIQRRLGELVGCTTVAGSTLERSGATKFVFSAEV